MATVTDLTNKRIADSYVQLLHTGEDGGLTSTPLQIYDGDGTGSALKLATTSINMADSHVLKLGTGNDLTLYHDGSNSYITNAVGALKIATETSGIAVTIGHSTSVTTVADDLSVAGDLAVAGTSTFNGVITLGDSVADTVAFGGTITGNLVFEGSTSDAHELTLSPGDPSGDVTVTLPVTTDTLVGKATTDTLTNKTLSGADINTGTVDGITSLTVGTDGSGADVYFYSATSGDHLFWDSSEELLTITGTNGQTALNVADGNVTVADTLTATNIGAFTLSGKLTAGSTEIEGSAFDIDGGDISAATISGGLTWSAAQDLNNQNLTNVDIDSGAIDGTTIGASSAAAGTFAALTATSFTLGGTAVGSTAAELNLLDGSAKSTSSITIADADAFIVIDGTTTKQIPASDLETYMESSLDTLSNVTTVGTLNSGAISSGFGAIDIGSSALSTTGSVTLGATSFGDNAITNVADIALDSISADGTDINIAVSDNSATALTIKQGSDAYLIVDTANSSESVSIGTGTSGTQIILGHSTSETTISDNLTVTGNVTISGSLQIVGDSSEIQADNLVVDNPTIAMGLTNGSAPSSDSGFDLGLKPHWHTGSAAKTAFLGVDVSTSASAPKLTYIPDASFSSDVVSGTAGTIVANLEGDVTGDLTGTASLFTASANNSTDETVYPVFVDGATGSQGAETDTGFTYNPSSGLLTIAGELDAGSLDVSGDADIDGTLEADAYTVDGTALATYIRDTVGTNMLSSNTESGITVTYDTSNDNIDFSVDAAQTGITSLLATDIKIGEDDQTKIDFETADEIHFYAANVEQVYVADNIFGPQSDSDVDLGATGVRWKDAFVDSITVTGEVDAASLDISGNADIDGTLETDNLTIGGSQGSDGQVLTSTGSGVAWESSSAATALDGLSDAVSGISNFTNSLILGHQTTGTLSSAEQNTAVGHAAMDAITQGDDNSIVGYNAGGAITTGSGNTLVGSAAGADIVGGSNNIVIGRDADTSGSGTNNGICLGHNITSSGDEFCFGKASNKATSTGFAGSGSCTFSYSSDERKKRNIQDNDLGLALINKLKTRTFQWKPAEEHPEAWKAWSDVKDEDGNPTGEKVYHDIDTERVHYGFIAQEVKAVLDEYGVSNHLDVWAEDADTGEQRIGESKFMTVLIKAVQELSAENNSLKSRVEALEAK